MDIFTAGFWIVGTGLFALAIRRDMESAKVSMKKSRGMMKNMIGDIVGIILIIGLILTFIPPETIRSALGSGSSWASSVAAAALGSVTLIPAFVAFPLVGSLMDAGASIVPGVAFLTTLTMVGVATFPLETKEFGLRFALTRNMLSFAAAIAIAVLMGGILA